MPTPRRRTPRSKIDEERAHLLEELRASEDTARPLIESYVTAERIEYLGGDPIVRRLNRLLGFSAMRCSISGMTPSGSARSRLASPREQHPAESSARSTLNEAAITPLRRSCGSRARRRNWGASVVADTVMSSGRPGRACERSWAPGRWTGEIRRQQQRGRVR